MKQPVRFQRALPTPWSDGFGCKTHLPEGKRKVTRRETRVFDPPIQKVETLVRSVLFVMKLCEGKMIFSGNFNGTFELSIESEI